MRGVVTAILAVVFAAQLVQAQEANDAPLAVRRLEHPPRVDGMLSDVAWSGSAPITGLTVFETGTAPDAATQAWIGMHGTTLYVAVHCAEPSPDKMRVDVTEHDGPVHMDDAVELFIDPGMRGNTYYHFVVNAAGTRAEQSCDRRGRDRQWNSPWTAATHRSGDGWSAELAIPFSSLLEQGVRAEPWRLNVARDRRGAKEELSTWVPLSRSFHQPDAFRVVSGLEDVSPTFSPRILAARACSYSNRGDELSYTVEVDLDNRSGRAGDVQLSILDQPLVGDTRRTEPTVVSLPPVGEETVVLSVPISDPCDRKATVVLQVSGEDRPRQTMPAADEARLSPLTAWLDRNYYTGEPHADVVVQISLPETTRSRASLRVNQLSRTGKAGLTVAMVSVSDATSRGLHIPLADVASGEHDICVLLETGSTVIARQELVLRKLSSGPVGEVKLDQRNRAILVDGEPFFPFGLYWKGEMALATVADIGFNSVIGWAFHATDAASLLDQASEVGLRVVETPARFAKPHLRYADPKFRANCEHFLTDTLSDALVPIAQHPALLAYYSLDEPDCALYAVKNAATVIPQLLSRLCRTVHSVDPYRPVFGLFSDRLRAGNDWWDGFDFGGVDVYPSVGGDRGLRSSPLYVAAKTQATETVAQSRHVPSWLVLNTETFSRSVRPQIPAEQRCQTYLSLIHGARGLFYFVGPLKHVATERMFRELAHEVEVLAPALLREPPPQNVTVTPLKADDCFGHPPVHAVFRTHPELGQLLLVANARPREQRMDLELGSGATRLTDLFSGASHDLPNNTVRLALPPYGTHTFRVIGTQISGPLRLSITVDERANDSVEISADPTGTPLPRLVDETFDGTDAVEFIDWTPKEYAKGTFIIATSGREAGGKCAHIHKPAPKSGTQIVSQWITLAPHRTYRYGVHARAHITEGRRGPSVFLYTDSWTTFARSDELANGKTLSHIIRVPLEQREWRAFTETVSTGPDAVRVRLWCQLANLVGDAWFDDLFVEDTGPAPKIVQLTNLIPNSSFETATLPGWPDRWQGSLNEGPQIGKPDCRWQQVAADPFHGQACLRVQRPEGLKAWNYGFTNTCPTPHNVYVKRDTEYTLSVYLKADEAGRRASFGVTYMNQKKGYGGKDRTVELSPEWQRYELTFVTDDVGRTSQLAPRFKLLDPGTMWVDAAQLEAGLKSTPYTP